MSQIQNRLANETSPYLQQHADNPVDWYPWTDEALTKAAEQNKPILLSIGYSACHWCHVMAHESFEDNATAALMNDLYVNIKVDREERPDLDKIYQTAQALLTQRTGGWPLTMFLTPKDHIPFFGGTYFPNEPRHGLPGFKDLLQRVEQYYRQHRVEIEKQNASLVNALDRIYNTPSAMASPTPDAIDKARQGLKQGFDARNGGFGSAPKFPHVTGLELLLRCWAASKHQDSSDRSALHMVIFTLTKMALGGIYDHLGGGFCRYSVDDLWMIPHFEKMLYDNGPLLTLYSEAATATGNELFLRTGLETADWVVREMQSPEGGYHSTLDADSEGEEGKYYVWSSELIKKLLDSDEYPLFARRFGLDRRANFEGHWHLHAFVDIEHLADEFGMHESEVKSRLDEGRQKLFREREKRIRPGRDEKILTSWNGLMIKGMAAAGRYFHKSDYIDSATRALDFVYETMWKNGRLLATYKDGKAHLNAYLDDYAFIIDAIVELLQCRWRSRDLTFACNLADVLLEYFEDHDNGGFYFTSNDHERLIQRLKGYTDESTPSGNGVAAKALARLGYIVGQPDYIDAAERTIKQAAASIHSAPTAHAAILIAYEEQLAPPEILILRGQSQVLKQWHQRCLNDYAPRRITLAIPNDAENLPAALSSKAPQGDAVAYACHGMTCSPPILNLEELDQVLAKTSAVL